MPDAPISPVFWDIAPGLTSFPEAEARMRDRVNAIAKGMAPEMAWLIEHPPLYTAGTSAKDDGLLSAGGLPVFKTGRGGQFTYHGPGQRVVYVMLDLKRRGQDVRGFVRQLEDWLIGALSDFNIRGERREGRTGVWVQRGAREDKIAAIGIRLTRWVSWHGIALNVDPDLSLYRGIVPCGIREHGVTSLVDLGLPVTMADADVALRKHFEAVFGPTHLAETGPKAFPITPH